MSPHTDPGALLKLADEIDRACKAPTYEVRLGTIEGKMVVAALRQAASQGREGGERSEVQSREAIIRVIASDPDFGEVASRKDCERLADAILALRASQSAPDFKATQKSAESDPVVRPDCSGAGTVCLAQEARNSGKTREPTPQWQRRWPHDQPNGWNLDSACFLAQVQANPMMWLALGRAKYLEMRIDTRDGGFNLYDRDSKPLNPDDVIDAIAKVQKDFGGPEISSAHRGGEV